MPLRQPLVIFLVIGGAAVPAVAQQPVTPMPRPLAQDPQQGATPRVVPLPPPPAPLATEVPVITRPSVPVVPIAPSLAMPMGSPLVSAPPMPMGALPVPSGDLDAIDPATDPVLRLTRTEGAMAAFRDAIADAVRRNPGLEEASAVVDEADAVKAEARSRQYPIADVSFSTFNVLAREFSGDPRNVLERSRPRGRTDGTVRVQAPVFDFGAVRNRIAAADARLRSAEAGVEDAAAQLALRSIGAWYAVFAYRALTGLAEAFAGNQRGLRGRLEERVTQGYAATGDLAQVDSYIASSDAQIADFRRARANAEAQYRAVMGTAPPADLARAPAPSRTTLVQAGPGLDALPVVRAADAGAAAAKRDARAAVAEILPAVSVGVDAGRYGVFETPGDYDVRGNVTLSMRFGGGAVQRADQAKARAAGADARARRTRIDAERDALVARSDVDALEEARAAIEQNYLASRRSRDVLAERFRVSRGTLFDVLTAETNYFNVAARYIQTVAELDTARYVLLARTARLLPTLGIAPDGVRTLP
jgi:adhesin transport system outer membrane protein